MSVIRPSDPTTPPDPLGSQRDIHLTGFTGVLTLTILVILQLTVFRHEAAPADLMWGISPVASYLASMLAGRWARRRLLKASAPPLAVAPGPESTPGPKAP